MNVFGKFLTQVKAQLAALNVSQKLVILLLGVIVLATIFGTVMWSAKPQMVSLIPQAMSQEEINRVDIALKGRHQYQISGNKILVPAEEAYTIRGELAAEKALPQDISSAISDIVKNFNPLSPEANNRRAYNVAVQTELTRWLCYFPYVETGTVIISMGESATLGRPAIPSRASVMVKPRNGAELSASQARAIVDWVSGAVTGMKRQEVHLVSNTGRSYSIAEEDVPLPANLLEYKQAVENHYVEQLARMFSGYGDVKIAVNVVPDFSTRTIEQSSPTTAVAKVAQETTTETASNEGNGGAKGEPGVQSMGQATADTGAPVAGRGAGSNSASASVRYENVFGSSITKTALPPGVETKDMTASLSLPRSYFVALYRSRSKDLAVKDPKSDVDDTKLQQMIDPELKRAGLLAMHAIGAKSENQIRVDWYDDSLVLSAPNLVGGSATVLAGSGWGNLVTQNINKVVLFALAAGVLGMMLMMVRRAVPAGVDGQMDTGVFFAGGGGGGGGGAGGGDGAGRSTRKKRSGGAVEQLDAQDDVFGEANMGEAVLTGIELDDETLQSRKMVDEVSTMIKDNPENAAALVKRWMAKNK